MTARTRFAARSSARDIPVGTQNQESTFEPLGQASCCCAGFERLVASRKDRLNGRLSDIAVAKTGAREPPRAVTSATPDNVVGCRRWRYENVDVGSTRPTRFPAASFRGRPTAQQPRGRRRRAARRTCSDLSISAPRHALRGASSSVTIAIRQAPVSFARVRRKSTTAPTVSAGGGSESPLRSTTRQNPA